MIRDKYLKIQKPTITKTDQGGTTQTWAEYWAGWGKVDEMNFKEAMEFGQPTANRPIRVMIRKNSLTELIDSSYRLQYRGRNYDITMGPREVDAYTLELMASCRTV